MIPALLRAVEVAVAGHRRALTAEFGWTQIDLQAQVEPEARVLRMRGQVLLPRIAEGLGRRLAPLLPPAWRLDVTNVAVRPGLGWRATGPGVRRLWRAPGRVGAGPLRAPVALTSELLPGDGPVLVVAELPGWTLVRAGDGTVGWLHGPLRPPVATAWPPPRIARVAPATALERLGAQLRGHLGVRYRLGGTSRRQIDCSGLVQRCVREALGLVLPRHSTDQLARAVAASRPPGEPGDLLFMFDGVDDRPGIAAAHCHVGVVLRGAGPGARTLIHASSRRGRVVEEPLDGCLARAGRVQHMQFEQLLALV